MKKQFIAKIRYVDRDCVENTILEDEVIEDALMFLIRKLRHSNVVILGIEEYN